MSTWTPSRRNLAEVLKDIQADFVLKVHSDVWMIEDLGDDDSWHVFTPYVLDDGDGLAITLKYKNKQWTLSDEAHTYLASFLDMGLPKYRKQVASISAQYNIQDDKGNLKLLVKDNQFGDALFTFTQALLAIANL
jgi:hypothetical protein